LLHCESNSAERADMSMVEVILLKSVNTLGDMGAVVRVSAGFARNYLIPNHMAMPSSPKLVKQFEHRKRLVSAKIKQTRDHAETLASKINKTKVEFIRRIGEKGKLFGSVTAGDIAEALKSKRIDIDRKQVLLADGPLKETGNHKVEVRCFQDIKASVLVEVKGEPVSSNSETTGESENDSKPSTVLSTQSSSAGAAHS
jgi:large subunit ribosomal protein L9